MAKAVKKQAKAKTVKKAAKKAKSVLKPGKKAGGAITKQQLIKQHEQVLKSLQYKSGLFAASKKDVSTGYDKSWLRDNFYECLSFEVLGEWKVVQKTYRALLDVFKKHEEKIDWVIAHKPEHKYQYIHARVHPETFDEFWEDWGNKQNDSIGAILFRVGELGSAGHSVIKNKHDVRIVQKLVDYLASIEYWHDFDSGMWEEDEEVHASSIGACVAGLKAVKKIGIHVSPRLIKSGEAALRQLLPRESAKKFVDLSLLSLIWPYNVVTSTERDHILKNVEYLLLRRKGVIRYKNDHYYNKNEDGYSEEAEWCFGLSWLAIIYEQLGDKEKTKEFIKLMIETQDDEGFIPELYFSNTNKPNENAPLGWAESLFVVALHNVNAQLLEAALR
ncbi:glycoside hydrolase family 15 [Candidatus Woesearchaeota archaeon]|nr:glycoside hydrolase family 15 [Candidatus Woesearchaeota archaeon]